MSNTLSIEMHVLGGAGASTARQGLQSFLCAFAALMIVVSASMPTTRAAELELRHNVVSRESLVRLEHVAVIKADDARTAARLKAIELFPAPAARSVVTLSRRELHELLDLRGFDIADMVIVGASQVAIHGASRERTASANSAADAGGAATSQPLYAKQEWEQHLEDSIAAYIMRRSGGQVEYRVAVSLRETEADWLNRAFLSGAQPTISGGTPPWSGTQHFTIALASRRISGDTQHTIQLAANITAAASVWAVARDVPRGHILTGRDLERVTLEAGATAPPGAIDDPAQAIGHELTRPLRSGEVIDRSWLRAPLLVRRNDIATLNVRSGAIVISTKVKALDDGAHGDIVDVQPFDRRERLVARVTALHEVEILAASATANR